MNQKNTIGDDTPRKNCSHKKSISIFDIVRIENSICSPIMSSEKWALKDKPAARIMLHGDDVHCSKCGVWGRYSVHGGGFIFPPHGYKVE